MWYHSSNKNLIGDEKKMAVDNILTILSTPGVRETAECVLGGIGIKKLYDDLASPTVKEAGLLGARVFSALVVGIDYWAENRKRRFLQLQDEIASNLKNKKQEDIVDKIPDYILNPALTSYMHSMDKKELRDMYAKLISRALLKENTDRIHPALTTIIQNLSPNECLLLEYLSEKISIPIINIHWKNLSTRSFSTPLVHQYLCPSEIKKHLGTSVSTKIFKNFVLGSPLYVSNLLRLGIIEITYAEHFSDETGYNTLLATEQLQKNRFLCERQNLVFEAQKGILRISPLGKEFTNICIDDI